MDSVIAESMDTFLKVANETFGYLASKKDYVEWDWYENKFHLTGSQMAGIYGEVWGNRWDEIRPTEPNIEKKVERLAELADVTVVTSAGPPQAGGKIKWLEKYGLRQIPILIVPYGKTKEALPYHIFVDDRSDTIEKVTAIGKIGFLYNQPWNQKCKVGIRIESLSSVISFLQGEGI